MSKPNWGNLVEQGRAKAFGIPWTEEELDAIYNRGIPVEFVRNGVLTQKELTAENKEIKMAVKTTGEKPLRYMSKEELTVIATDLGMIVTDDAKRWDLVRLIGDARKKLNKSGS